MFPLKEIKALQALCGSPAEFCNRVGVSGPCYWHWINSEYIPFKYWKRIQAIHTGILTDDMLQDMERQHLATLGRKAPRSNYDLS
jgi:hypothetical protein